MDEGTVWQAATWTHRGSTQPQNLVQYVRHTPHAHLSDMWSLLTSRNPRCLISDSQNVNVQLGWTPRDCMASVICLYAYSKCMCACVSISTHFYSSGPCSFLFCVFSLPLDTFVCLCVAARVCVCENLGTHRKLAERRKDERRAGKIKSGGTEKRLF